MVLLSSSPVVWHRRTWCWRFVQQQIVDNVVRRTIGALSQNSVGFVIHRYAMCRMFSSWSNTVNRNMNLWDRIVNKMSPIFVIYTFVLVSPRFLMDYVCGRPFRQRHQQIGVDRNYQSSHQCRCPCPCAASFTSILWDREASLWLADR